MKSNFWEEKGDALNINDFHEELLQEMEVPEWMNLDCPFCGKELPLRSIRSFGVQLNTRNLGDIVVEVLCDRCCMKDTVYFRQEIEKVTDFISFLSGEKSPKSKGVLEEEMYGHPYNNVAEKKASRGANNMTMIKRGSCESSVIISSTAYTCEKCGHMEVIGDDDGKDQECPKCSSPMKKISSQAGPEE